MALAEKQQIKELVGKHAERLGVPFEDLYSNLMDFTDTVAQIESQGNLEARNPENSARGLFQFVDGSIEPAIKRTTKYVPELSWMKALEHGATVDQLDKEQQILLFLGDILEKTPVVDGEKIPGLGDELFKRIAQGDKKSMRAAYEFLHHTDPDEATYERMNEYFGES